jgi:lipoprotein NlpD
MRAALRIATLACLALALTACGKAQVVRRDYPVTPRTASTATKSPPRTPPRVAPRTPPPAPIAIPDVATVTVRAGDTLYGLSHRYGLAVEQVAAWNDLAAPYTLHVGQSLRLRAPANATTASHATPTPGLPMTLPKPPSASPPAPAPFETVPVAPSITPSTTVVIPAPPTTGTTPTSPPSTPPSTASTAPAATAPPMPSTPVVETTGATTRPPVASMPTTAPVGSPATTTATTAPPATAPAITGPGATPPRTPIQSGSGPRWQWPTRGSLVGRYVQGDQTRQGIDIAGQSGQRVDAAADGVVVYSGAGLVGYGELVIVKHNDEWLSAYAHNRRRLVAEGTRVRAGDAIAEMGRTGAIRDMLHFEIRRNGKPVDPLQMLPAAKGE